MYQKYLRFGILFQSDQSAGSLKEELKIIIPQLEEMRKRKCERRQQFLEVLEQIQSIINELHRSKEHTSSKVVVDESDLSLRKLEELHRQLHALQQEKVKLVCFIYCCYFHHCVGCYFFMNSHIFLLQILVQSNRLKQIQDHISTLNSLCVVLGLDFKHTVSEVHFSLGNAEGSKDISNRTIEQLASLIQNLREVKVQRMQRVSFIPFTYQDLPQSSNHSGDWGVVIVWLSTASRPRN